MRKVIILLSLIILLVTNSCIKVQAPTAEPDLILRYADNQPEYYPTTQAAQYFASLVKERTNGRIEIEVFYNGVLGDEKSVFKQISFGGVDFSRFSLGTLSELFPTFSILQLPYLYRDSEHMWRVLDGEIGTKLLNDTSKPSVWGLCWLDAGARSFYSNIPITNTEDLKGKTIRVQESELMSRMIELFGATAVQMSYDDVYSALKLGIIDGAENNGPSYISKEHYQVAPFVFLDEHFRLPEIVMMSDVAKTKIEKIDPTFIDIIKECAQESSLYERQLWKEAEAKADKKMKEVGCIIIKPDTEELFKLKQTMSPIYEEYEGELKELINQILVQ